MARKFWTELNNYENRAKFVTTILGVVGWVERKSVNNR